MTISVEENKAIKENDPSSSLNPFDVPSHQTSPRSYVTSTSGKVPPAHSNFTSLSSTMIPECPDEGDNPFDVPDGAMSPKSHVPNETTLTPEAPAASKSAVEVCAVSSNGDGSQHPPIKPNKNSKNRTAEFGFPASAHPTWGYTQASNEATNSSINLIGTPGAARPHNNHHIPSSSVSQPRAYQAGVTGSGFLTGIRRPLYPPRGGNTTGGGSSINIGPHSYHNGSLAGLSGTSVGSTTSQSCPTSPAMRPILIPQVEMTHWQMNYHKTSFPNARKTVVDTYRYPKPIVPRFNRHISRNWWRDS